LSGELPAVCPRCGTAVGTGDRFCSKCERDIKAGRPAPGRRRRRVFLVLLGVALLATLALCLIWIFVLRQSDTNVLADAIKAHNTAAFAAEFEKGFRPERENVDDGTGGMVLLHMAAMEGTTEIVRLLLDRGVKVDLRTSEGATPLVYASLEGNTEVAKLLLDRGADVNNTAGFDGAGTPLMAAAKKGSLDTVKLLVERGADVNKGKGFWSNPLYFAADGGHRDVVIYLMKRGAQSDVMMTGGIKEKDPEMAKLLSQADFLQNVMSRVSSIKQEMAQIALAAADLSKRADAKGGLDETDRTKLAQYRTRLDELQKELQGLVGDQPAQ